MGICEKYKRIWAQKIAMNLILITLALVFLGSFLLLPIVEDQTFFTLAGKVTSAEFNPENNGLYTFLAAIFSFLPIFLGFLILLGALINLGRRKSNKFMIFICSALTIVCFMFIYSYRISFFPTISVLANVFRGNFGWGIWIASVTIILIFVLNIVSTMFNEDYDYTTICVNCKKCRKIAAKRAEKAKQV